MTAPIPIGARLSQLAAVRGEDPAIVLLDESGGTASTTSWAVLDAWSSRVARALADLGVGPTSFVGIALPNCVEHYVVTFATWKLGACPMPLRPHAPSKEQAAVLQVLTPTVMVGGWDSPGTTLALDELDALSADRSPDPLPPVVPCPGRAMTSGGSTGLPKLIVDQRPWALVPRQYAASKVATIGFGYGQRHLVVGGLYHTIGFFFSTRGLFEEHTLFVLPRFVPGGALRAMAEHRIQFTVVTPTHLQRMARDPLFEAVDLCSLEALLHTGSVCPPPLKRRWIERLGPTRVFESYGSTESAGSTTCRGDEWLTHPGTVGRPRGGVEVVILDERRRRCPPGVVGEVHFRTPGPRPFAYLGAHEVRQTSSGFVSVGDLGYLDEGGYLHIVDRRTDMIVTGGVNVFASEVELALLEHPDVADAVVLGLPDPEWGRRVHAVVVPTAAGTTEEELRAHCRARLSGPKVPKSFELVPSLPRDDLGKLRRSDLVAERTGEPTLAGTVAETALPPPTMEV